MFKCYHFLSIFIFCAISLSAETISTFYGEIEVEEPVIIELIHAPAFQRLKWIHQYGVAYYTKTHTEEYNRYDHSLGVFAILRIKGASLEEQIAGLLHDLSHTAFSHVGDWVFKKEQQEEDYQNSIHNLYLATSGIEKILNKHGYTIDQVSPKRVEFTMLEQPLPNLCADRIDYNIQGAYFQKRITYEEAQELVEDMTFEEGRWVLTNKELATKLTNSSLVMTQNCWGSALNFMTSKWLAEAILQGFKTGLISWHAFHFGTDQKIWDTLCASEDVFIKTRINWLKSPHHYCKIVTPSEEEFYIPFKCRGIDPWIRQNDKVVRLTSIDPLLQQEFQKIKELSKKGWPVIIINLNL